MKVFQILEGFCYCDVTSAFPSVASTNGRFTSDTVFVEAPDYVFEGWGYVNGEFIKPIAPEGWVYDDNTGTFYPENMPEPTTTMPENVDYSELAAAYKEGVKNA